jgi:GT2 family glycosyltransferase
MASTALVIPTYNRRSTLLLALSRLYEYISSDHDVIVVDSGSSDGTADAVRKLFPQALLLQGSSSMWWAAATNLGVKKSQALGCKYVLTYNDDNIPTPDLFAKLRVAAESSPRSIIAAVCCYLDNPNTIFFAGRMRAKGSDRFYYLNHNAALSTLGTGLRRVDMLHGMCTLFPMAVFDCVGLFNQDRFPQAFADDDLLLRAEKAGFALQVSLEALVLNDRSKTGLNPYDRRLGARDVVRLLVSRRSTFQLGARTRFLWRYRRSLRYFFKTWLFDYARLFGVVLSRWLLPLKTFQYIGARWTRRLEQR